MIFLRNIEYAYLGAALAAVGITLTDWRFWAILVPMILLSEAKKLFLKP